MGVKVTNIQKFCTHDGDGLRTTVFFKGCPLHCAWCHNPETIEHKHQLMFISAQCICCGGCIAVCPKAAHSITENGHVIDRDRCIGCMRCADICPTNAITAAADEMTVDEIVAEVMRDKPFYDDGGGVTLSGGEPLIHKEALEVLRKCKEGGITTAVETCGAFSSDIIGELVPLCDTFLYDYKITDPELHKKMTGVTNEKILKNLKAVDEMGGKIILRCIIVNGVNTDDGHLNGIISTAKSLKNLRRIELLPYHAYGGSKAEQIGLTDNGNKDWIPSADTLEYFKTKIEEHNLSVLIQR